jgi:hypothetical protein
MTAAAWALYACGQFSRTSGGVADEKHSRGAGNGRTWSSVGSPVGAHFFVFARWSAMKVYDAESGPGPALRPSAASPGLGASLAGRNRGAGTAWRGRPWAAARADRMFSGINSIVDFVDP